MRRFFKFIFKLSFFFLILSLLLAVVGMGGLYYLIVEVPCPEMDEANISSILGQESPVYYRDGQQKIGVLFQEYHRQYLTYEQIPQNFVHAIVSAEDNQFFHHYGIDFPGIARAMVANYKAGRIVQGGSTISQQTAKNLFKRQSRSYEAKLKELLYALRLEYRYPKEKILEFYSNQFYVSGNGHGLGVAARYYFNKNPMELTLLEAAFIAGSVKRPNYYNPFIKKNKVSARQALVRADERAQYVLKQMLKQGFISKTEHDAAVERDIIFNRGKTSFALNSLIDLVKDGLATQVITDALEEHGITNISTSGARIITTIDRELQEETLYGLRRHLSLLDVRLRGYEREQVQQEYTNLTYQGDDDIREKGFVFGTISSIDLTDPKQPLINVHFNPKQSDGFIDRQGLERMALALKKFRKGKWSTLDKNDLKVLLSRLQTGDRIYVSIREVDIFDNTPTLDLERFPHLQGAALVMQQGAMRAIAGGMENRFYNRAIAAKRLMGSTFKPFLFSAALQLGWSPVDRLDNRRNVFIFMDQAYFPRPDHHSPFAEVSMSWAGVKSENVAAVWLLYHLADQLTPPRLLEVAGQLDMAPHIVNGRSESYQQFKERIRDRFGIHISRSVLDRAAYERAVKTLEADFLFDDRAAEYLQWKKIPYGLRFSVYRDRLYKARIKQAGERNRRLGMLSGSYLQLQNSYLALQLYQQYMNARFAEPADPLSYFDSVSIARPAGSFAVNEQGELLFTLKSSWPDSWQPLPEMELRNRLQGLFPTEMSALWNNILLEGTVSSAGLSMVQQQIQVERAALASRKPYSMEVLSTVSDYRVMLGLQYLIRLARESGIFSSRLDPVLSFPLGSNVVSLAETVRMYETLVTGNRYDTVSGDAADDKELDDPDGLAIIDHIIGADGRIIYRRQVRPHPVLDVKTSSGISNILQNVIHYGTGRYAYKNVRLSSDNDEQNSALEELNIALPLLGKTGTANDFRNAAFMGYVPTGIAPEGAALTFSPGYTVGVYVGFDSNESMKKGSTRISGAQGALPVWTHIANAIYKKEKIGERLDPVDLVFNGIGLKYPDSGQFFVPVDHKGGGLIRQGQGAVQSLFPPENPSVLAHGSVEVNGYFARKRDFIPFWRNQQQ